MNETPEVKQALKIIAGVFIGYFVVLGIVALLRLPHADQFEKLIMLFFVFTYLPFVVLMIGVVRERQAHEKLFPKVLVTFLLAVCSSLVLLLKFLL